MQKRVNVLSTEKYEPDFPPENLLNFAAWLQEIVAQIPAEHRVNAVINLDSRTIYDTHYATVEVYYTREETPEEAALREEAVERAKADRIARLECELAIARSK